MQQPSPAVPQVLLHALSFVSEPADLHAVACTAKSMLAAASDAVLMAEWLFKHKTGQQDGQQALSIAVQKGRGDVMLLLLQMGVPATVRLLAEFRRTP